MEGKQNQVTGKSNKIGIAIIILIIVAIVGYALWQQSGKQKDNSKAVSLQGQLELTQDNLIASWERQDGEYRHEIGFELGDKLLYCCFDGDDLSPIIVAIRGSYSISNNIISVNYTIDSNEYSEKYYAAVSAKELLLSPVEGSGDRLKGTYINVDSIFNESETAETEVLTSSAESDTVQDETTDPIETETESTPPETQAPPVTQAPPETTAAPEPPAFDTSLLLGSWCSGCRFERTPDGDLYSMGFDTDVVSYMLRFNGSNVTFDSGFWMETATSHYYEPFESRNFIYRVEGDLVIFSNGTDEYIYRISLKSGGLRPYDFRLDYVSGNRLSTWDIMWFSLQ